MARTVRGGERYWALRGIKVLLPVIVNVGDVWVVTANEVAKKNHG